MPRGVTRARQLPPYGAPLVAALPLAALLACGVGDIHMKIFDDEWDFGDASFIEPPECKTDADCGPGRCCAPGLFYGTASCENLVPADPTHAFCTTTGDDHDALCFCHPPQSEPFCPQWIDRPPYTPECAPAPYVRCGAWCTEQLCACSTFADERFYVEIASCPPADWAKLCPSDAGSD